MVVGEYESTTPSSKTGRTIHRLFVGRLEAQNGQFQLLRESINLVELGMAICTNGLADYKVPESRNARTKETSLVHSARSIGLRLSVPNGA